MPIQAKKSDPKRSQKPNRGRCHICKSPKRLDIEAALLGSGDGVRKDPRKVAEMGFGFARGAILRHERDCMKRDREAIQTGIRNVAAVAQVESGLAVIAQSAKMTASALAARELDAALALSAMADKVARILADKVVGPDGVVDANAVHVFFASLKATVEARGGGAHRWAELKAKLDGDLATGTQVNVQVNVALQGALQRVGEENGRWLTEDAPAAVRAGLAELGVAGPALERGTAAVVRHLVAGRAGLGARIAAVLDAEVGT